MIYRDEGERVGTAVFSDGTMVVYDETQTTAKDVAASGVWNTWSFLPALLEDGEIVDRLDTVEVDRCVGSHPCRGASLGEGDEFGASDIVHISE